MKKLLLIRFISTMLLLCGVAAEDRKKLLTTATSPP